MNQLVTSEQLVKITRDNLGKWYCYDPDFEVRAGLIGQTGLWLYYRHPADNQRRGTHFDANIDGPVFYLLEIGIADELRGQGLGEHLYEIIEQIATEAGCEKISQMPSGAAVTGESREDYLFRRGWIRGGNEVHKWLKGSADVGLRRTSEKVAELAGSVDQGCEVERLPKDPSDSRERLRGV